MSLVRRFDIVPTIDRNKPTMCNPLYNVIISIPTCDVITNSMSVICKLSIRTTAGPSFMFLYMKNYNVLKQTFPQHSRIDNNEANAVFIPMINGCNTAHPTPFLSG